MEKASGLNSKLVGRWKHAQRQTDLRPIEALNELYTARVADALSELAELAKDISPVEMVTATNHGVERDKWMEQAMKGEFTTPIFEYNRDLLVKIRQRRAGLNWVEANLVFALKELPQDAAGNALRKLAKARLNDVKSIIGAADAIYRGDPDEARAYMTSIYGVPSERLVRRAKETIKAQNAGELIRLPEKPLLSKDEQGRLAAMKLDAEAVKRVFLWATDAYGLTGTRPILIRPGVTAMTVHDASSEGASVVIPEDYEKSALQIPQLVGHEIGCHWRDSENVRRLVPQLGGGSLKPLDELFYEGHAAATEYDIDLRYKGIVRETRRLYYPVAIKMAYWGDMLFGETARALYDIIKSESEPAETTLGDVWQTTYRVYRGNPRMKARSGYAFTKDRAYYAGRLLAHDLKAAGLGYFLDYGTLSVKDLSVLAPVFQMQTGGELPYPERDLTTELYQKLLKGEFLS